MRKAFEGLTTKEIREVGMYGCTEAQMREAVESSPSFRFSGPAMVVASMMSDAQEMLAQGNGQIGLSGAPEIDTMVSEDVRQLLNRAKFVLFTYIMDRETA